MDGAEFVRSIQEGYLKKNVDSPTRKGAILDQVLGNEPGQVVDVSVGKQLRNSDHNLVNFNVLMDKDKCRCQVKVLNCGKVNCNNIRQELKNVDWRQMFEAKSTSGMWEPFKCMLLGTHDRHVPVRMKNKYGKLREPWITRDIVNLVKKKKEAFIRARRLGTREAR
eukprot:g16106.t1